MKNTQNLLNYNKKAFIMAGLAFTPSIPAGLCHDKREKNGYCL
jgi:hypothetical protein